MSTLKDMATRAGHATTRSARYALGPGADLPIARIVAFLLIVLAIGAIWMAMKAASAAPSPAVEEIATFNPKSLLADNTPHFLPTPVAAMPPDGSTDAATAPDQQAAAAASSVEHVKVANTGGVGAILRADPPRGRQVGTLRDGTTLEVIEHQTLPDGSEWLHVRTPEGAEGWIFSRLVTPADQ
jgi:SH3 domain-containing protein